MKVKFTEKSKRNFSKALKKAAAKITKGTHEALIKSAALVRRSMDMEYPVIPVDINNLRASYFTSTFFATQRPYIVLGFTANYATYVHEKTNKEVNWQRPGSGPLFFVTALDRNRAAIIKLLQEVAK